MALHSLSNLSSMATAAASSSSSSCAAVPRWDYDVFISFRGDDTRAGFVSHLERELRRKEVHVFIDYELERGEKIDSALERKIESSRIAIVVFSPKFADSTWCLWELTKILEMKHSRGQLVRPVFLGVEPSHVRKQTGVFAEIMATHEKDFGENSETVKKWRDALSEAADLSGWHLDKGTESELIQKIVEEVSSKLHRPYLYVAKHPVALDKHIHNVRMSLCTEDDSVRVVSICGTGGIGKTTIAKAVYNMIADQFEGSSFLANVREILRQYGLHKLLVALLRDILGDKTIEVGRIQIGVDLIREKLGNKRVLLVLDNVDCMDQLRDLMGERSWLGQGSRIMLTTRDEEILVAQSAEIYKVGELNHDDALQLFSLNAFQESSPAKGYPYPLLSDTFVHYAQGLPLALIVLGSFLSDKSTDKWRSTLERLSATPGDHIDEILKISFEGLETHEQAIFLDIACFFNGEDKIKVARDFDRCNFYPDIGLHILSQKSLIYMESNKIRMHDLLQEMGQEIVRQESPENPGKRSRLCSSEDIRRVFQYNLGTRSVQGIKLDMLELGEVMSMGTKSIKQMKRLRLLMFRDKHLAGCPEYLSNDIKLLCGQEPDNKGKAGFDSEMLLEEYSVFKKYSKAELGRATNDFRDEIGRGSAGSVYRGKLDDGREVAIKWTKEHGHEHLNDMFITEIKTLRHVNHKNVIRLLGFHARGSECALVYEYMKNNSLSSHLHTIGSSTLMSWNARIKVALDVARGIEYLHEFAGPQIVHRDIKSANILLGENWTAKVSDFGVSVLRPEGLDEFQEYDVVGTIGYLDPEYISLGILTTKTDVYSYGIVLLELLSGFEACDVVKDVRMPKYTVSRILHGKIDLALDRNMPTLAPFERIAVTQMANLAVDCVQKRAVDRPSMSCVVDRLRSALAQFPSELSDNTETSRSSNLRPYSSPSSDSTDVSGSSGSSWML